MPRKIRRGLVLVSLLLVSGQRVVAGSDQHYAVIQTFPLRDKPNGVEGTLHLLVDSRLTPPIREELWGHGDWSFVLDPSSALYKGFCAAEPLRAKIEIRNVLSELVAERTLETPLAKLEEFTPVGSNISGYLLTQDFSIGAGSYNGLTTTLLTIRGAKLRELLAINNATHKPEVIRVTKALKADWRIVSDQNGTEILAISCHPDSNLEFVVDYVRIRLEWKVWYKLTRQESGMWESDHPFPPRSAFP